MQVPLGQSLLEAAHSNDIDLEGKPVFLYTDFATQANQVVYNAGACEGSLACSTCHVIVEVRSVSMSVVLCVNVVFMLYLTNIAYC